MRVILSEELSRERTFSLDESVQAKSNSLGTIKGVCADYKEPTRNGNFYSRTLWENVFKDPLVKEALNDRVLIGELDHPCERLEANLSNACIVMTGYEFDDNNNVLLGTFDILPTSSGKILRSLLDYGCKIGVSSRGEGDVTTDDQGRNVVAEDGSYYFVGFDAVAMPAVKKAKPALQESLSKRMTFKESLSDQINSASTKAELELIKNVIEATELPDSDSLLESINNKSKELEGTNSSSNLLEDLERANSQINTLQEENRRLKEEVTNSKSKFNKVFESRRVLRTEMKSQQDEATKLKEDYNGQVFELASTTKKLEESQSNLRVAGRKIKDLEEELKDSRSSVEGLESKVTNLEESLERSQATSREKTKTISKLREELESTRSELSVALSESKSKVREARRQVQESKRSLSESNKRSQDVLRTYAIQRSKDLGVDPKVILESIKPGATTKDVDKVLAEELDRSDRYRKMPDFSDPIIGSLSKGTLSISSMQSKISEEDAQTASFMEQYYNQNK